MAQTNQDRMRSSYRMSGRPKKEEAIQVKITKSILKEVDLYLLPKETYREFVDRAIEKELIERKKRIKPNDSAICKKIYDDV